MGKKSLIYSPLDKSSWEIRVVSLNSEPSARTENGMLSCSMKKVSLLDLTKNYQEFSKSSAIQESNPRQITTRWARRRSAVASAGGGGSVAQPPPHPDDFRFQWGDYSALSYVWGEGSNRREIEVNGTVVSVTVNLEVALRALSRTGRFRAGHVLWVDALCINQGDLDERASQVGRMRDIYSRAWSVVSWLGESSDKSDMAVHLLRSLATLAEEDQANLGRTLEVDPYHFGHGCFYGLNKLMDRDYWYRLWIVQEIILGGSSTMLHCGDQILQWTTFCAGLEVLYRGDNRMWSVKDHLLAEEMWHFGKPGEDNRWITTSLHLVHQDLRPLSRREEEGGKRLGMRRLLEVSNASQCRETRDKVYALIGMMATGIADAVIRDYQSPPSVLFATVTRAFIEHHNNLEPLRQANPWGPQEGPTWAADWTWESRMRWSRPETPMLAPNTTRTWNSDAPPHCIYNAHSGVPARYSFPPDGKMLKCQGFLLDEVRGLGAPEQGYFAWNPQMRQEFPQWKSAYGDEMATARALSSALLLGRVQGTHKLDDDHLSALLRLPATWRAAERQFKSRGWGFLLAKGGYYFRWEEWRAAHDGMRLGHGERTLGDFFRDDVPEDADQMTFLEAFNCIDRSTKERRFILTKGGYLGWATENLFDLGQENDVRIGDQVAIVFGCSTPIIVRRHGEHYQVLGEAYVEGFMEGEGKGWLENGQCQVQYFNFI